MPFHSGEIEVQTQAGKREEAQKLCSLLSDFIKPAAQEFLVTQQLAIASTVDIHGQVWASLLTGQPGFIQVLNQQTLQISLDASLTPTDPLYQNLHHNQNIGLLVIDLSNRRRSRFNGKAELDLNGIKIHVVQTFFNCPKYIQTRHIEKNITESKEQSETLRRENLSEHNQLWITQADTFFIASFHPQSGADASHRGGFPGFIQVLNHRQLLFPDYAGNNMFQTFGNLLINPNAGLLFIDFETGDILQITGKAKVIWDADRLNEFIGAERLVEFAIEQVLETTNSTPLRWRFGEYSPANPG
ncbi:pyridoxamine 5'-phosphate oxidase family protein [Calothrix sp. UHCC 0171]|uniref:pyridoxamine 5'-phosphate oxidase family protein n=1 Tax=Calothrix sp. UHCC 0171 TaxID=3110245 RepID=UPI002B2202F8|nr:pyridoxamine 5'-phosphate oxidase family protein [Calothrix sp. UHCC 0171]MEA5574644.1 pyridoxamine 5'-phosphate oxidase family protein [Calothrix sp. UHCC 0171]